MMMMMMMMPQIADAYVSFQFREKNVPWSEHMGRMLPIAIVSKAPTGHAGQCIIFRKVVWSIFGG